MLSAPRELVCTGYRATREVHQARNLNLHALSCRNHQALWPRPTSANTFSSVGDSSSQILSGSEEDSLEDLGSITVDIIHRTDRSIQRAKEMERPPGIYPHVPPPRKNGKSIQRLDRRVRRVLSVDVAVPALSSVTSPSVDQVEISSFGTMTRSGDNSIKLSRRGNANSKKSSYTDWRVGHNDAMAPHRCGRSRLDLDRSHRGEGDEGSFAREREEAWCRLKEFIAATEALEKGKRIRVGDVWAPASPSREHRLGLPEVSKAERGWKRVHCGFAHI